MAGKNYRILDERDGEKQKQENLNFKKDISAIKNNVNTQFIGVNNKLSNFSTTIQNVNKEISVIENRVNVLAKMEEGSTTGDAELIDIRVGADGEIYDTAGDSIRTQFNKLKYFMPTALYEAINGLQYQHRISLEGIYEYQINRLACNKFIIINAPEIIYIKDGYNFAYNTYEAEDENTALVNSGWLSGMIKLPTGILRITLRKSDDSDITVEEGKGAFLSVGSIVKKLKDEYTNYYLSKSYIPLDKAINTLKYQYRLTVDGAFEWQHYRVASPIFITLPEKCLISIKDGYNFAYNTYEAEDENTALVNSGWLSGMIELPTGILRITLRKSDDSDITVEEAKNAFDNIGETFLKLKDEYTELIQNIQLPSNQNIKSINHRGYVTGPENTLSAYKLSKLNGFEYVETDVSFTSDNVAVCLHDDTIDRTSNGTGNISQLTFDEVRVYDFGSWKSTEFEGEKIPSFEEFIELCKNIGLHPYIELKNGTQTQIEDCVNIVKKYGMKNNVTWISFSSNCLNYIKNYDDKARMGYIVNKITDTALETIKTLQTQNNNVFIDVNYTSLTNELCSLCITNNIELEVWTVNNSNDIISLNPYVTGVTSDKLIASKILINNFL